MKKPIISIYITSYNYKNYLKSSIESALNQSFPKDYYEIILIDDHSNDGSIKLIQNYVGEKNLRIILNKKNKGLIKSINLAIKACRGDYVIRLDADDRLHRDALKELYSIAKKDKNIGIIYSDFYLIDKFDNIIKREKKLNLSKSKIKVMDTAPHGACSLIKKNFLIENGMYDESFDRQDGYDLWYKFIKKYKIKNINKALFYYRQHGNSLSKNTKRLLKTRSKIIEKFIKKQKKVLTYGVIPIRGKKFDQNCISFKKINKKPILFIAIDNALKSKKIDKLIISSGDNELLKKTRKKYKNKILYHLRESKYSYENTSYMDIISTAVNSNTKKKPENVIILNIECPFRQSFYIDKAINNHIYHNADRTVAVMADNTGHYYKYGPNGLSLISNRNYSALRTEKKYIFTGCGGIEVVRFNKLEKSKDLKTTSHIIMDKKSGFVIKDDFDLKIAQKLRI